MDKSSRQSGRSGARIWTRDFVLLMVIQTIDLFTYNMMTPVLAQYSLDLGVSLSMSGALVSAFALAALFARPFSGRIADTLGKRRIVAISIAASLAAQVMYIFVASFPLLVAVRVVHGAFYALFGTAIVALATLSLPEDRQNEGMGWFGTSYVIANALGPALGIFLTHNFGFTAMFTVGAAITALSLLLTAFVKTRGSVASPEPSEGSGYAKATVNDFISIRCIPLAVVAAAFMTIWGIIITYVVMVGDSRGVVGMSVFFVVNSVTLLVSRPTAGRMADRHGLAPVFAFSVVAEIVAVTLLTLAGQLWAFMVAAACKALGSGTVLPSVQANCGMMQPPERRGAAMATYLLGTDIGNVVGPLVGGCMAATFGLDSVFLPGYALCAVCVAGFFAWRRCARSFG